MHCEYEIGDWRVLRPALSRRAASGDDRRSTGGNDRSAISLCFDTQDVFRIDAAAKRLGISRADWLHFAVGERLARR